MTGHQPAAIGWAARGGAQFAGEFMRIGSNRGSYASRRLDGEDSILALIDADKGNMRGTVDTG